MRSNAEDFNDYQPATNINFSNRESGSALIKVILTLAVLFLFFIVGLYVFYVLQTPPAERSIVSFFTVWAPTFPAQFGRLIEGIRSSATNTFRSESNSSVEEYGLKFNKFESVGGKRIPSGASASFKYIVKVSENTPNTPVELSCNVDSPEIVDGEISLMPSGVIQVSSDNQDIANNLRCNFKTKESASDKNIVVRGSITANIPTQRNSIKVYLLDEKEYNNLKGQDFFKVNNKQEKLPIKSVYSKEPVEVGIGVSDDLKQPVVVGDNYYPMVGLSLINRWDGKVKSLESMSLFLPDGVSIDEEKSPKSIICPFEYSRSSPNGKTRIYDADKELLAGIGSFGFGESENFKTFECRLSVEKSLVEGKKTGFVTAYYVDLGYVYVLREKTDTISLAKKLGLTSDTSSEKSSEKSESTPESSVLENSGSTSESSPVSESVPSDNSDVPRSPPEFRPEEGGGVIV